MIKTVRPNINAPYSLHDMNVIAFEADSDHMIMRTQSGMCKVGASYPCGQPDGYVEFYGVQWDFCYAYLLDITANEGKFTGEKMFLKEFIEKVSPMGLSIMDETYGYNCTKYSGYLTWKRRHYECFVEIYHEGDMVFIEE